MTWAKTKSRLARFRRREEGVALVEFAIVLLIFAVIIEGGRLFWSYQATILGVRDATRYLARVAPADICVSGGTVAGYQSKLENIVRNTSSGNAIFPGGITITAVVPSVNCVVGNYRGGQAAIATVTASLAVTFPLRVSLP